MGSFTYYLGSDGAWYAKVSSNYYKVEPVKWCVINENYDHDNDSSTPGKRLLLAENSLTGSIFYESDNNRTIDGNTVYPNDYKHSRIRALINGLTYNNDGVNNTEFNGTGLLQTAFTSAAQNYILQTKVRYHDNAYASDKYVQDYIFLLDYDEATSITPATNRIRTRTDFTSANGLNHDTSSNYNNYWLRWIQLSGTNTDYAYTVHDVDGNISSRVRHVKYGIVPALCIDN